MWLSRAPSTRCLSFRQPTWSVRYTGWQQTIVLETERWPSGLVAATTVAFKLRPVGLLVNLHGGFVSQDVRCSFIRYHYLDDRTEESVVKQFGRQLTAERYLQPVIVLGSVIVLNPAPHGFLAESFLQTHWQ
ncbi:hypothetical protein CH330_02165, partial [candidate division WOR-3 bacterium JGI_Cruoil_03_51_56]